MRTAKILFSWIIKYFAHFYDSLYLDCCVNILRALGCKFIRLRSGALYRIFLRSINTSDFRALFGLFFY